MNLESSPVERSWNQAAITSSLTSVKLPETFTFTFVTSKLAKSSARVSQSKFVRLEAFLLALHCLFGMSWTQAIMPGAATFISLSSRHVREENILLRQVSVRLLSYFPRSLSRLHSTRCYTAMSTPQVSPYRSLIILFWGRRRHSSTRQKLARRFSYVLPY